MFTKWVAMARKSTWASVCFAIFRDKADGEVDFLWNRWQKHVVKCLCLKISFTMWIHQCVTTDALSLALKASEKTKLLKVRRKARGFARMLFIHSSYRQSMVCSNYKLILEINDFEIVIKIKNWNDKISNSHIRLLVVSTFLVHMPILHV